VSWNFTTELAIQHQRRNRRFSVSIFEEGGRVGLKCSLLSYFRVGDNPTPELQDWGESELETRIGLL
jgi:hypothetical protein